LWEDGSPRVVGQFERDRRNGKWTWYDRAGRKTLEGSYEQGQKHGVWREWTDPNGLPAVEHYLRGHRIEDLDALLARLSADLFSEEVRRQVRAAHNLQSLGRAGLPLLRAALRDPAAERQLLAIRTLQHLGPLAATAVDDLEATAKGAPPRVKFRALVALAEVDPQRAPHAIDRVLAAATGGNAEHREPAARCLTRAGPASLQQLVAALNADRPELRLVAFEAISGMYHDRRQRQFGRTDLHLDLGTLHDILYYSLVHFDAEIRQRAESQYVPWGP
jgi:hypothetical protein